MQKLEQKGYTRQQIIDMLQFKYGNREIRFRYDLLGKNEVKKNELLTVESGEVEMSSDTDIKRTAKFTVKDDGSIDWLNDRIQPFCLLKMPDGNYVEWSLGIFLLSSPIRKEQNKNIYRDIEAYDGLQILKDDKFDYRLTLPAGINYITAVSEILSGAGIAKMNLEPCTDTLAVDREWDIGTEKLSVINELLKDLNYTQLWVDEWGYFTSRKYVLPQNKLPEYVYKDDSISVLYPGTEENIDFFSTPNKFVVVASNTDTVPLTSIYINSNPESPISTISRGRTIVDCETIDYVSSQEALDGYTRQKAFKASQVYGEINFETAIMPFHSYCDVLQIQYSPMAINGKYEETGWSLVLKAGEKMKHTARKVVKI